MILTALAVLALSDQPVATAGRDQGHVAATAAADQAPAPSITAPRDMSTDEQIAAWIAASPAAPTELGDGPLDYDAPFQPERRIRGQVTAAVGSHDYRAFGAEVSVPIGESGFASFSYSESKGGPGAYYPYGGYYPYSGYDAYGGYFHDGHALRRRPSFSAAETWDSHPHDRPITRRADPYADPDW